ncbi:hypothetical protein [Kitasatospora sp. CB01950]|uniref:hypothetical protein n=1 Tax=Kitasatospora sp. CB01950 TaxID=1703930 RepID=UPI000938DFDE|nr:hypothetical protein [Kitasatospora sp. CB01950]OKJ03343.1 hypothetical protein AMK19_27065 [Kitasatospora sp. CB01950]
MNFHSLARRAQSIAAALVLAAGAFTGASPAHATDCGPDAQLRPVSTTAGTGSWSSPHGHPLAGLAGGASGGPTAHDIAGRQHR